MRPNAGATPRPSPHAAGSSAAFASPASSCGPRRRSTRKARALTREDMARHLGAHLCRCTGYVKILDAIETVARAGRSSPPRPGRDRAAAGPSTRPRRWPWATGATSTTCGCRACFTPPCASPTTPAPTSSASSTAPALAAPGVSAVFTAADVPGDLRVGIIHHDWPVLIPEGGRTSYAGDVLAMVVAETRQAARAAAALVEVTYEPLRPITDPVLALASTEVAVWGTDGNVLSRSAYARGDVDTALAASAHVVHERVRDPDGSSTPSSSPSRPWPCPAPTVACTSTPGGQGVWDDRDQIAAVLGVGPDAGQRGAGLQRRGLRRQGGHVRTRPRRPWPRGFCTGP